MFGPRVLLIVGICLTMCATTSAQTVRRWYKNFPNATILANADWSKTNQLVATDSLNNCFLVSQTSSSRYNNDIQIMKVSPTGSLLWERWIRGTANRDDRAMEMAVDRMDNLIIAGYVSNASSGQDALVAKYSPTGEVIYSHQTNGRLGRDDQWEHLTIGSGNTVFVMGSHDETSGIADWSSTLAVQARSMSGTLLWSQTTEGLDKVKTQAVFALRTALSPSSGSGTTKKPPGSGTKASPTSLVTVRFEGEGWPGLLLTQYDVTTGRSIGTWNISWSYFGSAGRTGPKGRFDDFGSMQSLMKLHCSSSGEMTLVGNCLKNNSWSAFVIRFNSAMAPIWATRFEPTNRQGCGVRSNGVVVDSSGNCFIGGYNYLDSILTNGFVARIGNTGTIDWQHSEPRLAYLTGGLAMDSSGMIFAAGRSDALGESRSRLCVMSFSMGGKQSLVDLLDASNYTFGRGIQFASHNTTSRGMAFAPNGTLYVGGSYGAPAFGANLLVAYGNPKR